MTEFNFETFDRRNGRLVNTPELTVQAKGTMSMNLAAYHLLGKPEAVELLFDRERKVVGIRGVAPESPHAYPLRGSGKGGTYTVSARAFFAFYNLPLGTPVRREVRLADGVLIVDLNDPGRVVQSNRVIGQQRRAAAASGAVPTIGSVRRISGQVTA